MTSVVALAREPPEARARVPSDAMVGEEREAVVPLPAMAQV
jgi:hypothetical protein